VHYNQYEVERRSFITRIVWCAIGFLMTVAGGYLGYYVIPLLFTMMPVGAVLCATLCWRLTRV
jgi:hypothetical protein